MAKIANKQVICDVLMREAEKDKDIVALCSDSRGSASFSKFADTYPEQFIETGIAEQNLVSISAGLAKCGKKPYAASPACFLSTRSYEQCKVDVAYSNTNVKLIGINPDNMAEVCDSESCFGAGYSSHVSHSQYESLSSKRQISDRKADRGAS